MDNLEIYNKARQVPPEAKKEITAGRLKGMTDINPMWRIKRLTELFGVCGFGWWYEITKKEIISNTDGKEIRAFVDINLYVAIDGKESKPIPGTGGSSFQTVEKNGIYVSDECFKMALTDAISVAAKSLGIAADIYYDKDRTKYTAPEAPAAAPAKQEPAPEAPAPVCADCKKPIEDLIIGNKKMSANAVAESTLKRYGRQLCAHCGEIEKVRLSAYN